MVGNDSGANHFAGRQTDRRAAMKRPSLKSVVGLAPGSPTGLSSLADDKIPTMFIAGQRDPVVTPSYLDNLKIFLDNDTRYSQFLCPTLLDKTSISMYRSVCPLP